MWSLSSRTASSAACSRGWSVFTRPSRISGDPVSSATSRTSSPASRSAAAVPPVEMISTPRSARPRAKSTIPVLSETEISARRTSIASSAAAERSLPPPVVTGSAMLYSLASTSTWTSRGFSGSIRTAPAAIKRIASGSSSCSTRWISFSSWARSRVYGTVDRLLQDNRPRVDPLVDQVHGHPGDRHPVRERLADRVEARERGKQRRMHVDDPVAKPAHELRGQELHVAGEDDQVDIPLGQPVRDRGVARGPVRMPGALEHPGLDPGLPGTLQRRSLRLVRGHAGNLDPIPAVQPVENRLQVGPRARREDGDRERAGAAAAGPGGGRSTPRARTCRFLRRRRRAGSCL